MQEKKSGNSLNQWAKIWNTWMHPLPNQKYTIASCICIQSIRYKIAHLLSEMLLDALFSLWLISPLSFHLLPGHCSTHQFVVSSSLSLSSKLSLVIPFSQNVIVIDLCKRDSCWRDLYLTCGRRRLFFLFFFFFWSYQEESRKGLWILIF
jgi:hypothetical protein